jgi:hypothetical protein
MATVSLPHFCGNATGKLVIEWIEMWRTCEGGLCEVDRARILTPTALRPNFIPTESGNRTLLRARDDFRYGGPICRLTSFLFRSWIPR